MPTKLLTFFNYYFFTWSYKTGFLCVLLFGVIPLVKAQDIDAHDQDQFRKHTIKIGVPVLGYEYALSNKKTINFQAFFIRLSADKPEMPLDLEEYPLKDQGFVSAFIFNAEYRFYLSKKHSSPRGFYLAPLFRFTNGKFNGTDFLDDGTRDDIPSLGIINLRGFGLGGQCGVQWVFNDKVTLDWGILGLGANVSQLKFQIVSDQSDVNWTEAAAMLNEDIMDDLEEEEGFLGRTFTKSIDFKKDGESILSKSSFMLPFIRTSITLGIRF